MDYYKQSGISNSALSYINPEQGGSPLKYKTFITDAQKKEDSSITLENGKLVHKYVEDKDLFVISDVVKPSDMMSAWVERVFVKVCDNPDFVSWIEKEEKTAYDNMQYLSLIVNSREGAYAGLKDAEKIKEKFIKEGEPYLLSLFETHNKHIITSAQKKVITGCIEGIQRNPIAQDLLFGAPEIGDEVYSEKELYWQENIDGVILDCKGLVDKLRILHSEKKIIIMDFKTTGKHISLYRETFIFRRTNRQLAYYERGIRKAILSDPKYKDYTVEFFVIAVETQGIHECRVFSIDMKWIEEGREEYTKLLTEIATRSTSGIWTIEKEELNYG